MSKTQGGRVYTQAQAAIGAARGLDPASLVEEGHDLDQVIAWNIELRGNLTDSNWLVALMLRDVHQNAQAEISEFSELHVGQYSIVYLQMQQ